MEAQCAVLLSEICGTTRGKPLLIKVRGFPSTCWDSRYWSEFMQVSMSTSVFSGKNASEGTERK